MTLGTSLIFRGVVNMAKPIRRYTVSFNQSVFTFGLIQSSIFEFPFPVIMALPEDTHEGKERVIIQCILVNILVIVT